MACENTIGMVTIVIRTIVRGKLFRPNEQYCYKSITTKLFGCGCGGKKKKEVKYYVVEIDNVDYELKESILTESNVDIDIEDQSFIDVISHIGGDYSVDSFQSTLINKPDPAAIRAAANDIPM